jgi:23S rRNA pseudouridine2457 synthase
MMTLIKMSYYLAFNKPYGVLSQFSDSKGRDVLKNYINLPGVYSAGRLDFQSEGLLILSNDGPFIHRLTDPKYEHPRTYLVQVEGAVNQDNTTRLQERILLPDIQTKLVDVQIVPKPELPKRSIPVRDYHETSWLIITLKEGKKHIVRKLTAAIGFPTLRLVRLAVAGIDLGDLKPGQWRMLFPSEITQISKSSP